MSRLLLLPALVLIAAAHASATPGPGPGELFGGDNAGCVPVSSHRLRCSLHMAQAFDKLEKGVVKCHTRQAKARFSTVVLGQPEAFDEEACKTAATDRFDGTLSASAAGICAGSPVLVNATADRAAHGTGTVRLLTSVASHHFDLGNNLFVGPAALASRVVDWAGPIDDGQFNFDGYFPDGVFRFNLPPAGLTSFGSFAALQAAGMEVNGVLLAEPIFASGLVPPPSYTATLTPADVTLAASSNALDAGRVLRNVNDGWVGAGPDLGALERGCSLPIFGIRPEGVDESNEPLGCVP